MSTELALSTFKFKGLTWTVNRVDPMFVYAFTTGESGQRVSRAFNRAMFSRLVA